MASKYNISDELLAAFLEGNVSEEEMTQVLQAAQTDAELQEALDIAMQLDDAEDEHSILQIAAEGNRNLCDVQCEAYVLKQCGVDCSIEELLEIAKDKHWIRRAGTPLNCIGNLMEYMGMKVVRKEKASVKEVADALQNGCGVIVAVDSDKLYPERPDEEDATNHAVVVTGINEESVTIYDPGNITEVDIKLPLFVSAWHESQNYMVSVVNVNRKDL